MKRGSWAVAAAFVLCASNQAYAEPATFTIDISGYVPVICRVATDVTTVDSTGSLGTLTEFCNNPTGYQVWVDYAPGATTASISVNGNVVPLSASGSTMIDSWNTAASTTRALTLNNGQDLKSISFRVVPI